MADTDPNGLDPHELGAKLDANKIRLGLVLLGFSNALSMVGEVGTYGARKYTENGWVSVDNGVERYTDAMLRHLLAESTRGEFDDESGLLHCAHVAWNALARLELMIQHSKDCSHE